MGRLREKSADAQTSGGCHMPKTPGRTRYQGQGQLPWIAYSLRDVQTARAEQSRLDLSRRL